MRLERLRVEDALTFDGDFYTSRRAPAIPSFRAKRASAITCKSGSASQTSEHNRTCTIVDMDDNGSVCRP